MSETIPLILKGEDRTWGGKSDLFVDLIPSTSWFTNVRSVIRPCDWNRLRHLVYTRANGQCECCSASPATWGGSLEAHERWHYNTRTGVQKLMRIIALCKMCHTVTHMGLADIRGVGDRARSHLMRVAKISRSDMENHCESASRIWSERSKRPWKLDLSIITNSGYELKKPKQAKPEKTEKIKIEKQVISKSALIVDSSLNSTDSAKGRLLGTINTSKITLFRIELTVYPIKRVNIAKNVKEYWWIRCISNDDISVNDARMPRISAARRLHVSCKLRSGRYIVGHGTVLNKYFTVGATGGILFD